MGNCHYYLSDDRKECYADELITQILTLSQIDPIADAVDLGCGTGIYVSRLQRAGIDTVGVDNNKVLLQDERLWMDKSDLAMLDLSAPLPDIWAPHDLVLSIEVAEHIVAERCEIFLRNVCRLSKKWIVMTASDEVGLYHVNPQPYGAWVEQVCALGTHEFLADTSKAWMEYFANLITKDELRWFKRNLMIFRRKKSL